MRARICVCIQSVSKVWKRSNILKKHSILEKNVSDKVVEFKTILKKCHGLFRAIIKLTLN